MNRVVHFEIQATDPDRAQRFYESVFGWKIFNAGEKYGGYRLVMTGPGQDEMMSGKIAMEDLGINGGMVPRKGSAPAADTPANGYVCLIAVSDVDEIIGKIEAAGGTVVTPKEMVPNIGELAYYKDTEGNIFGIIKPVMPEQK